jgi:hypothetical protein
MQSLLTSATILAIALWAKDHIDHTTKPPYPVVEVGH